MLTGYPSVTAEFGGQVHERQLVYRPRRKPRTTNGESRLWPILLQTPPARDTPARWWYEYWSYPQEKCWQRRRMWNFTPDFWAPPDVLLPGEEAHIELTRYPQAIAERETALARLAGVTESREVLKQRRRLEDELADLQEGYERKRLKVCETKRLYGVRVFLVTEADLDMLELGRPLHELLALPVLV